MHNTAAGMLKFGPAFNQQFLEEVFRLQQSIEEIGQQEEKGLEKICFAPMVTSGEPTESVSQCVVQSIFGYFENSLEKFRESREENGFTVNYLNRLDKCFM